MYPFSFSECLIALKELNGFDVSPKEAFEKYINVGGYPFLYNFKFNESQQKQYLDDIFNSIILKDICNRYKIRDVALLKSLITFFISNIGNSFSSSSLIKYLKMKNGLFPPKLFIIILNIVKKLVYYILCLVKILKEKKFFQLKKKSTLLIMVFVKVFL